MSKRLIDELSEFSKSLSHFRFNKDGLKFEKSKNNTTMFIYCMVYILDFLDYKKIKYSIEYNQDIVLKN